MKRQRFRDKEPPTSPVQKGRVQGARNGSVFFSGFLRNYKMSYQDKKEKKKVTTFHLHVLPKVSVILVSGSQL